jgi:hypothetical protein
MPDWIRAPDRNSSGTAATKKGPGEAGAHRGFAGRTVDPETKRVLSVALEMVCIALRVGDCDDGVKQAIATKLNELAKAGENTPISRLHFLFQRQDLMKLLNISRGPQKKRGKDRFGAAENLNKMHAPDTFRCCPPVCEQFYTDFTGQ